MLTQEQQFVFAKSSEAAESQVLFGPPALLSAESPAEYWRLYSLLQAELAPEGVLTVKDWAGFSVPSPLPVKMEISS